MKKLLYEIIGWYGTIAIGGAYELNSFGIVSSHNIYYQLLNVTGSIGIIVISLAKKVYQTAVLNIVWAIIALIAIVTIFHK